MKKKSIRWRLTLSFAGIALLAALSSGAVLLTILQRYYAQRELDYLNGNALAISQDVAPIMESNVPDTDLQALLENFSFLSQTRVRLLDSNGQMLRDSGIPREVKIGSGVVKANMAFVRGTKDEAPDAYVRVIAVGGVLSDTVPPPPGKVLPSPGQDGQQITWIGVSGKQVIGTPYGFQLNGDAARDGERSDRVVRQPVKDAAGQLLGFLELSEGPSYGRDIVNSVAWGWALASTVAILLAAGVGWYVSRRISAPVLVLANAASRMAAGDLTTRAGIGGQDELGRLASSFDEMASRVEATVSALQRFIADATHELHTPLTALRTNLELLADEADPAKQSLFIERTQAQAERISVLTRELLDLSRLEANGNEVSHVPTDLAKLVREASELHASRAEQADLSFSLDLPPEPLSVSGNAQQLRQALENLLDNAIKFTPAGGTVSVGLRRDRSWVEISVQDTGIGIPAEDMSQLFDRFHRGRNATAYSGSGLGLAIVKAIVQNHGGTVAGESADQGTRFTIRLPASA